MSVSGAVPVAVIGVGCRFPGGVDSPASLWRLLLEGRETVGPVPPERWDASEVMRYQDPDVADRFGRGCFLAGDVWAWEPAAFAVAPTEGAAVDPQHRLAVETAWEAVEHAGIPLARVRGSRTGVYLGLYAQDHLLGAARPVRDRPDAAGMLGGAPGNACSRVTFALDLRGPAMVVESLCSSGLAAVHLAGQALAAGECEMALAGASLLMTGPQTLHYEAEQLTSATGHCFAFDERADGFVRGEGCGMLLLKRLDDAVAGGDRVLAVIRGSALSCDGQDGRLTAPSPRMQQEAFRQAVARAGIDPGDVGLVETHGPGTPTGDPVEYTSVNAVYGRGQGRCALGSVKTNFGHSEPTSGIAGLIKAVWAVREGIVPANVNFRAWNPAIALDEESRLFVPVRATAWPVEDGPRLAAVCSYGLSGTNAHVIIEGSPRTSLSTAPRPRTVCGQEGDQVRLFLLSASSRQALGPAAGRLADWVETAAPPSDDLAHTLAVRRSHAPERLAVCARTRTELVQRLRAFAERGDLSDVTVGQPVLPAGHAGPVFVFTGQGSQSFGMCRQLLDADAAFTAVIDEIEPLMREIAGFSLRQVLAEPGLLSGVERIQPALFAVQIALAALWRSWGVEPAAVIGQSMGEISAAVVAGALSLRDGLEVNYRRAVLANQVTGGLMASVLLDAEQARNDIAELGLDGVSVAVLTSPGSTVVSGRADQVRRLVEHWQQQDVSASLVEVDYASHSPHVDPILDAIRTELAHITPATPAVTFYTTAHEDPRAAAAYDGGYWALNLRAPVRLRTAVEAALDDGHRLFIECSPHPLVVRAVTDTAAHAQITDAVTLGTLRRETDDAEAFARNLAAAHCAGAPLTWERRYPGELVDAPTTTWHRVHQRPEPAYELVAPHLPGARQHSLLGGHVADPDHDGRHLWQTPLSPKRISWLADHKIGSTPVMAGAGLAEMALAAARHILATDQLTLTGLDLHAPLLLDPEPIVTTRALNNADGSVSIEVSSRTAGGNVQHATACVTAGALAGAGAPMSAQARLATWTTLAPEDVYAAYRACHDVHHGPAFQGLEHLQVHPEADEAVAHLRLPAPARVSAWMTCLHPALLDSLVQAGGAIWRHHHPLEHGPVAVAGIGTLTVLGPTAYARTAHLCLTQATALHCVLSASLMTADGQVVAQIDDLRITNLTSPAERFTNRLARVTYQPYPLPERQAVPPAGAERTGGAWCVLAAEKSHWARELAKALTDHGYDVHLRVRSAPTPLSERDLTPPPDTAWSGIVVAVDGTGDTDPTPLDNRLATARLCEVLRTASAGPHPPRVWAAVRQEEDGLHAAGLSGVCRTAAYEYPQVPCGLTESTPDTPADLVAADLLDEDTTHRETRWQHGQRSIARLTQGQRALDSHPQSGSQDSLIIRDDASYLITGAFGGLGLLAAQWLAEQGAGHLLLFAHHQPTGQAVAVLDSLRRQTKTTVVTGDIGDAGTLHKALAALPENLPLRGVLHTAAVVEDATLDTLDHGLLARVWHAKTLGAWHLHHATHAMDLDFFALYSSAAALLGSPGQAAYAAANAYLDTLAQWRRNQHLPVLSVQWGAWAEAGRGQHMEQRGLALIEPDDALTALAQLLTPGHTPATIAYAPLDLARWLTDFPATARSSLFTDHRTGTAVGQPNSSLLARLATTEQPEARTALLQQHIITTVQETLGINGTHLDPTTSLVSLGIDSLTAMRLRQSLQRDLTLAIPQAVLWTQPTAARLTIWLLDHLSIQGLTPDDGQAAS
ncbi:SDR family NAD(P)-dependent oxidoreductase [Streptomyces sp. NPDC020379]|uniref:type I polyketide synthase n=1 Tax=Streptomyces sp. NPDC020379 TaxID=3365071 RepID=UPI003798A06C